VLLRKPVTGVARELPPSTITSPSVSNSLSVDGLVGRVARVGTITH
jgi:hypothetical protein